MPSPPDSPAAELTWDVAQLFPAQGHWDIADYLALTDHSRHLVELVEGTLEVLPMPTESHQLMVQFLFLRFHQFLSQRQQGLVVFAPIRVATVGGRFREPDLALLLSRGDRRRGNRFWKGADLVVEVVSEDAASRARDLETKRREYAQAGVQEYWIIDPSDSSILVLQLAAGEYQEVGHYSGDHSAASVLLEGLMIQPAELFRAATGEVGS